MNAPALQQMLVGSGKGKPADQRGCSDEPIGRILVRKLDQPAVQRDFVSQGGFRDESLRQRLANPDTRVGGDLNFASLKQHHSFPNADWRQPKLIFRIFERRGQSFLYSPLLEKGP